MRANGFAGGSAIPRRKQTGTAENPVGSMQRKVKTVLSPSITAIFPFRKRCFLCQDQVDMVVAVAASAAPEAVAVLAPAVLAAVRAPVVLEEVLAPAVLVARLQEDHAPADSLADFIIAHPWGLPRLRGGTLMAAVVSAVRCICWAPLP